MVALAATGALTLGGCQWTSPVQTEGQYAPADGWSAGVGALDLRNLLVVADAKGGPGNVVGLVMNTGADPIDVSVQGATGDKLTVAPGRTEQFTTPGGRTTTLPNVDAAPGALTTLHVTSSTGDTDIQVPVLAPTQYYATLAPSSGSTGTPTANPSATGNPSAPSSSPAPTGTATPTGGPASTAPAAVATTTTG